MIRRLFTNLYIIHHSKLSHVLISCPTLLRHLYTDHIKLCIDSLLCTSIMSHLKHLLLPITSIIWLYWCLFCLFKIIQNFSSPTTYSFIRLNFLNYCINFRLSFLMIPSITSSSCIINNFCTFYPIILCSNFYVFFIINNDFILIKEC